MNIDSSQPSANRTKRPEPKQQPSDDKPPPNNTMQVQYPPTRGVPFHACAEFIKTGRQCYVCFNRDKFHLEVGCPILAEHDLVIIKDPVKAKSIWEAFKARPPPKGHAPRGQLAKTGGPNSPTPPPQNAIQQPRGAPAQENPSARRVTSLSNCLLVSLLLRFLQLVSLMTIIGHVPGVNTLMVMRLPLTQTMTMRLCTIGRMYLMPMNQLQKNRKLMLTSPTIMLLLQLEELQPSMFLPRSRLSLTRPSSPLKLLFPSQSTLASNVAPIQVQLITCSTIDTPSFLIIPLPTALLSWEMVQNYVKWEKDLPKLCSMTKLFYYATFSTSLNYKNHYILFVATVKCQNVVIFPALTLVLISYSPLSSSKSTRPSITFLIFNLLATAPLLA
jgi:hypothetical protein